MTRVKAVAFWLALSFFSSAHSTAIDFGKDHPARGETDRVLNLHVEDRVIILALHEKIFEKVPSLKAIFDEEKSPTIAYSHPEEASAFIKICHFLYSDPKKPFDAKVFQDRDLAYLISLAMQHKIDDLIYEIALFLRATVEGKLRNPQSGCILDELTKNELQYLYNNTIAIDNNIHKYHLHMNKIKDYVNYYLHLLVFEQDPRVGGYIKIDNNIYRKICSQRQKNHKAEVALEKEQIRQTAERNLDANLEKIAEDICTNLGRAILKRGSYVKKHKFSVPEKHAQAIVRKLQDKLPDYNISLPGPKIDLTWGRQLTYFCDLPCSAASCAAQAVGWVAWMILYPVQLLTCDFCIPCCIPARERARPADCCCLELGAPNPADEWLCGSQSGMAVTYCVHEALTCGQRTILIVPNELIDSDLALPAPPPVGEADMTRT